MKRTIALVMSLLMLLVLVPTTALADTDVHPYLDVQFVTLPTPTKTLFQFGTEPFNWTSASLVVKLYDDTATNVAGTLLPTMGTTIAIGTYVLLINGEVFNPAVPYTFLPSDIGTKTLTVKYTYRPTGNSKDVTLTKDVTISVQKSILSEITATAPTQTEYYEGEFVSLSGVTVQAKYTNTTTDPVTLASDGYTVTSNNAAGTNPQPVSTALVDGQTKLIFSRTEKYPGSETEVTKTVTKDIVVKPTATSLTLSESTLNLLVTAAPVTVTATTDVNAALVANINNPAVASIDTSALTSSGTFVITPLSVGTAQVTVRTRGSNITQTISVNVTKAPTLVGGILLDKATVTLPLNSPFALTATLSPDDTTNKTIVWTSSSPSNVSVDSTGSVKVLRDYSNDAAGSGITVSGTTRYVTITATATNGDTDATNDKVATCLVAVNTIAVDGISISDTSMTLNKGSWKQLSAVITPTNAANPAVTWSSSNPAVATVDSTGKVTAVGIPAGKDFGEAIITAQTSNASVYATCSIKVVSAILITSLTLNKSELALNVGEEETLQVTGAPSNATNKTLVWKSSNTDVASVSGGKVIAAAKGSAVIRAEATDGSGKYVSCVVTVNNIQVLNVSLDKSSLDLSEGDTAKITATIYPANATTSNLKWTSSNSSVATVDSKGNVVAGATKGYAIITVSATDGSGKFAECVVLSKPKVHVAGITINYGTTLDLLANDSTYLKATVLPANATVSTVTWSSSAPAVASVDAATGLLKGLTLGEAIITATADGKTVTIKVNVTNTEFNYGVATGFKRRVNVRTKASGLSKSVGFAYNGDTFKILGKSGSWYLIQYNNTTKAYIWSSYLKATKTSASYTSANGTTPAPGSTPAPGATATPVTANPTKVTIANCQYAVNIRASASTSSKRIGKGNLGATFTYLGKEGDWYKIQYDTKTIGYVFATFATLS